MFLKTLILAEDLDEGIDHDEYLMTILDLSILYYHHKNVKKNNEKESSKKIMFLHKKVWIISNIIPLFSDLDLISFFCQKCGIYGKKSMR